MAAFLSGYVINSKRLFIRLFFCIVGIYHYFLDLEPGCIYCHKCTVGNRNYKRQDNSERGNIEEYHKVKNYKNNYAESCHNIALETDYREDKRVFEYLENRKVKGNKQHIHIKTHKEIQNCHRK